jgi:type IV pilus assembly protein PilW
MKNPPLLARARGVSLIELMIALAIGSLLVLGLVEVFSASRTAYQLSEGLARVQENGRFAVDYIQRDFRMAGHLGCVNDQSRFLPANAAGTRSALGSTFLTPANQLAENYATAAHSALRFDEPIQGYEYTGTAPGATRTLAAAPVVNTNLAAWTPALPADLGNAMANRIDGSDIIVLRQFSPRGAQVKTFAPGDPNAVITVDGPQWANLTEGDDNPRLFGIADCLSAGVFYGNTVVPGTATSDGSITVIRNDAPNFSPMAGNEPYIAGQAYVYKAETLVYYVGLNGAQEPALYRLRVDFDSAGAIDAQQEELVEGIESLQLRYGLDSRTGANELPTGNMGSSEVAGAATPWRRVGLIQVGLVARSANPAAVAQRQTGGTTNATKLSALGVEFAPPSDTRYRTVYESTIALRNRLFGH